MILDNVAVDFFDSLLFHSVGEDEIALVVFHGLCSPLFDRLDSLDQAGSHEIVDKLDEPGYREILVAGEPMAHDADHGGEDIFQDIVEFGVGVD